jgi:hypothetical protein
MSVSIRTYLALSKTPLAGPAAVASWYEISDHVSEIHVKRGRSSERSQMEAGTLSLALDDTAGWFNAANTASPLYPYADISACVKVEVTALGTTYPVIVAYGDDTPPSSAPKVGVTSWSLVDGVSLAAGAGFPAGSSYSQKLSGASVSDCLTAMGWTGTTSVAAGIMTMQAVAAGGLDSTDVGARLQTIQQCEDGAFFFSRAGVPTFRDKPGSLAQFLTLAGVFSDDPLPGQIGYVPPSLSRPRSAIENDWRVTPQSGAVQAAADAASKAAYGNKVQPISLPLAFNSDALSLARRNLRQTKDPHTRRATLSCALADEQTWAAALALELGNMVRVDQQLAGASATQEQSMLQSIALDVVGGTGTFSAYVSPADSQRYWLSGIAGFSESGTTTYVF